MSFILRGDGQQTQGDVVTSARLVKARVYSAQGTMTGLRSLSLSLSRTPEAEERGHIYFHDIGDYLERKQKLETIKTYGSINGIEKAGKWTRIIPDRHGDWLNQRDDSFDDTSEDR